MLLILSLLFALMNHLAYKSGFGPLWEPLLKIPVAEYYFWQRYFIVAVFFIGMIASAGAVRLLARSAGGRGQFEDSFALLTVSLTFPAFLLIWLPEALEFLFYTGSFLPGWLDWARHLAMLAWGLVIAALGIHDSEEVGWFQSGLLSLTGMVPMSLLYLIFVR